MRGLCKYLWRDFGRKACVEAGGEAKFRLEKAKLRFSS